MHLARLAAAVTMHLSSQLQQAVPLWDPKAQALHPCTHAGVSHVVEQGLYAPMTLGGTVIVNGVAASVHSEWFLDGLFDFLGQTHMLPSAYQVLHWSQRRKICATSSRCSSCYFSALITHALLLRCNGLLLPSGLPCLLCRRQYATFDT